MVDENARYDNTQPRAAIMTTSGITVAISCTEPPSKNWNDKPQEIHLLKLYPRAPAEIMEIYYGRAAYTSAPGASSSSH